MFIGEYNHNVDTKGRVSLPIKFREELSDTFYITRGMEKCLFIYDREEWFKMDQKIRTFGMNSRQGRGFARQFYAGAMEVSCDKQGRILIPPHLRTFAEIDKEVTVIGVSDRIEIWSKENWESYLTDESMDYDLLTDSLEEKGVEF